MVSEQYFHKLRELGCNFSLSGYHYLGNPPMKYLVKAIPEDRLLLETDSPYALTPLNPRNESTPGDIVSLYEKYAELTGQPIEDVEAIVQRNFSRLYSSN